MFNNQFILLADLVILLFFLYKLLSRKYIEGIFIGFFGFDKIILFDWPILIKTFTFLDASYNTYLFKLTPPLLRYYSYISLASVLALIFYPFIGKGIWISYKYFLKKIFSDLNTVINPSKLNSILKKTPYLHYIFGTFFLIFLPNILKGYDYNSASAGVLGNSFIKLWDILVFSNLYYFSIIIVILLGLKKILLTRKSINFVISFIFFTFVTSAGERGYIIFLLYSTLLSLIINFFRSSGFNISELEFKI